VNRFAHQPRPDRISVKDARAQLAMLLCGCTDQRLAAMTAEGLAATHRVPVGECRAELEKARAGRGL
jgi:hypothetical protein